jgi:TIR domain-containing protein
MADIFFSYASQDKHRIKVVVDSLEGQGWTVWWDRDIPPGSRFDQVIEEELDAAKCIIVAWSEHSVVSEWVKNEASAALERGLLVPILIDDVRIPLAFRRIQAAHLANWKGESEHEELGLLFRTIDGIIRGTQGDRVSDPAMEEIPAKSPHIEAIIPGTGKRNRQAKPTKKTRQVHSKDADSAKRSNNVVSKTPGDALVHGPAFESGVRTFLISEKIRTSLRNCLPQDGLYVDPEIPPEKLANATRSSGVPPTEHILGLIDCTVFGSSKNCLLFGSKGIYFHNGLNGSPIGPGAITYDEFPNQEFRIAFFKGISLGDNRFLDSSGSPVPRDKIQMMLVSIREIVGGNIS